MNEIESAEKSFNKGNVEESLMLINTFIEANGYHADSLMLRAKVYYKMQQWGNCLNDLNKIIDIEPQHTTANNYKQMVNDIIRFWNKDSFNP